MDDDIIFLDLNEVNLWGFEDKKSEKVIESIVLGIEAEDDFPAVQVYRLDDTNYQLTYFEDPTNSNFVDGGHNRAVAHYIANKPLKCRLYDELKSKFMFFKIQKSIIIDDIDRSNGQSIFERTRRNYSNYRSIEPKWELVFEDDFVYLDLSKVELWGWEHEKSDKVIDSIVRGIELGDDFPVVYVEQIDEATYQLTTMRDPDDPTINIGGHTRAVGHFIAGKRLKCEIIREVKQVTMLGEIKTTIIENDLTVGDGVSIYAEKKASDPKYR